MDCSTPGFPVLHCLQEFAQIHVYIQGCHLTISSSASPFSSCSQSFQTWWSFPMSRLFASGGQSIGASTSASFLPMNIQGWFPLGLTGLSCFLFKGLSRVFFSTTIKKYQLFSLTFLYGPALTSVNDYWKNHSFNYTDFCWQTDGMLVFLVIFGRILLHG